MNNSNNDSEDSGAPLPDFRSSGIQLQTIAPALGVTGGANTPDYIEYDPKARGFNTVFANAGMAYLIGTGAGGLYGLRLGLQSAPSTHFRVRVNSILNQCGRYGSRAGNTMGVFAVLYSLYEVMADQVRVEWIEEILFMYGDVVPSHILDFEESDMWFDDVLMCIFSLFPLLLLRFVSFGPA